MCALLELDIDCIIICNNAAVTFIEWPFFSSQGFLNMDLSSLGAYF